MNWESPAAFFEMGGYGLYVWGSYVACLVAMIAEPILARKRRNEILKSLRRAALADQLDKEAQ